MCLSVCDSKSRQSKGRVQNPEARLVYLKVILHGDCNLKYRNKMCHDILSAEKVRVKEGRSGEMESPKGTKLAICLWPCHCLVRGDLASRCEHCHRLERGFSSVKRRILELTDPSDLIPCILTLYTPKITSDEKLALYKTLRE